MNTPGFADFSRIPTNQYRPWPNVEGYSNIHETFIGRASLGQGFQHCVASGSDAVGVFPQKYCLRKMSYWMSKFSENHRSAQQKEAQPQKISLVDRKHTMAEIPLHFCEVGRPHCRVLVCQSSKKLRDDRYKVKDKERL